MDRLTYPNMKADLDLCFKQLHEICGGDRSLAIMSVPPQQTDFDMQFHSAFDELQAYRDTGLMPDEIKKSLRELKKYRDLGTVKELDEALYNATL